MREDVEEGVGGESMKWRVSSEQRIPTHNENMQSLEVRRPKR